MKFIANIPIFRRLFYAFLLAAVIPGIIIFMLGATFISRLNDRSTATAQNYNAVHDSRTISNDLNNANQLLYTMLLDNQAGDTKALDKNTTSLRKLVSRIDTELTQFRSNYELVSSSQMSQVSSILTSDDPNSPYANTQHTQLNQVSNNWMAYGDQQKVFLKDYKGTTTNTVGSDLQITLTRLNDTITSWNKIVTTQDDVSKALSQVGNSQTQPILITILIAFLITVSTIITIGYIVNLTITRPLRQLATLTKRIAKGETAARALISGRDEIYMVATSMNNMLDNIVRLIQETQSQRDALQAQVEKLVSEVSGVGEGDLRVQAEVTADALGVLADSFNYMVEELSNLVVRVKVVAHEVESNTTSVLDHMTQLVESGDRQINQIGDAAIEIERMATASRQVAERAQFLYNVANTARQNAQTGREALGQAIEGMGRINENVQATAHKVQNLGERSREINDIVEVIQSISHQTNRLALDAAIQAAMAGENGKGFGAVAADIRRLAERSKDQAGIIARIVRGVREEIGAVAISMQDTERETATGARLTQEAGISLESIFSAVEHQAHEIENINQVAIQQQESSQSIVGIMQGISQITQQSGISTREASQNMERLARLVEQLRASVEAFKLNEGQGQRSPATSTSISMDDNQSQQLTVSGVFRTVSSTAQPAQIGMGNRSQFSPAPVTDEPWNFYTSPSDSGSNKQLTSPQFSPALTASNGNGNKTGTTDPRNGTGSEDWTGWSMQNPPPSW